jgi:hypothetical protein
MSGLVRANRINTPRVLRGKPKKRQAGEGNARCLTDAASKLLLRVEAIHVCE